MDNNSNYLEAHPLHGFVKDAVIVKSPYRISLGGGGTDLPFYFKERGGLLISASINQYMTVSAAARVLDDQFFIQTTYTQVADQLDDLTHDIIRESLRYFGINKGFQVATYSTLPTTTGLGASSTLMVALVNALNLIKGNIISPWEVAKEAHHIERNILSLEGGIQDQYIAALGGVKVLEVSKTGEVSAKELNIAEHNRHELERGLVLIHTSEVRDSTKVIKSQQYDKERMLENYDKIKEIGQESIQYLLKGDIQNLGEAMDRHWKIKKRLSKEISNSYLDDIYNQLKKIGSPGGKIIGAGGGGFFMMAVPGSADEYLKEVSRLGFRFLDWRFEFNGAHMIDSSP
jgi:D-glycero-alpha-D-manno-heptose-7-phosphate kinase